MSKRAQDIVDFWFDPAHAEHWFVVDAGFDAQIRQRFGNAAKEAGQGRLVPGRPVPTAGWHY